MINFACLLRDGANGVEQDAEMAVGLVERAAKRGASRYTVTRLAAHV